MKILVFGDAHITERTEFSRPAEDGLTDHLHDILHSFQWLRDLAAQENVQMIVNLGDMLDSTAAITESVLYVASQCYQTVSEGIPYFQLLGNHDYRAEVMRDRALAFVQRDHMVAQPQYMTVTDYGKRSSGYKFGLLALPCMSTYPVPIDRMLLGEGTNDRGGTKKHPVELVVGHASIVGAKFSVHSPKPEAQGLDLSAAAPGQLRYWINGHYHCPAGDPATSRVIYAGSLVAQSFDDALDPATGIPRGAIILDANPDQWDVKRVENPYSPVFVDRTPAEILTEPHPERLFVRVYHDEAESDAARVAGELCRGWRPMPRVSPIVEVAAGADDVDEDAIVLSYAVERAPEAVFADVMEYGQALLARRKGSGAGVTGRRIEIQRAVIHNFATLGDVTWCPQIGLTQILGQNDDAGTTGDSNGAGKSSLLEALQWGLYGDSPKGKTDEVIREGQHECSVVITLVVNGAIYTVWRGRDKRGPDVRLYFGAEPVETQRADNPGIAGKAVVDATKMIADLIGVDYDTFCQIVLLRDDATHRFMSLSPADRVRQLEDAFGMAWYDQQSALVRKEAADAAARRDTSAGVVQAAQTALQSAESALLGAQAEPDHGAEIAACSVRLQEVTAEVDGHRESLQLLRQEAELSQQTKQSLWESERTAAADVSALHVERAKIAAALSGFEARRAEIDGLIQRGVCPVCRSQCPPSHFLDEVSKLDEACARLRGEMQSVDLRVQGAQTRVSVAATQRTAVQTAETARTLREREINTALRPVTDKQVALQQPITSQQRQQAERDVLVRTWTGNVVSNAAALAAARSVLSDAQHKHVVLDWWCKALATDGVRREILKARIAAVNRWLELNAQRVWSGGKVQIIHRNGTKIGVSVGSRKYERHSRGERCRIDMLVQLLLNRLYRLSRGVDVRFVGLDEVLDGLDASGLRAVVTLIGEMLSGLAVYVTSHNVLLQTMIPNTVVAHRSGGVTTVRQM